MDAGDKQWMINTFRELGEELEELNTRMALTSWITGY